MILTLFLPTVKMVRDRRGESEHATHTGLTAVMTAISAVHRKDARALFRFRKSAAAGRHDLFGNVKMPAGAAFGPTRQRTRAKSRGRPIRTYVGTVLSAWQPQKTNWCHSLTAESENCRLVGQHHCAAENGLSAELSPPLATILDSMTQTAPGKLGTGPGSPAGPP